MQHIIINEFARSIGLSSERLVIREKDHILKEVPLKRISTVNIQKQGVSLSSNLLAACARHGVKVFIGNRHNELCCLQGSAQHAVVKNRINQYQFLEEDLQRYRLSRGFIYGKVRNQRACLLCFSKQNLPVVTKSNMQQCALQLEQIANKIKGLSFSSQWNSVLMGLEGSAAALYWQCLATNGWLGGNFSKRIGRGAQDGANQALNYGYGILKSTLWSCLINAGLEPYLGALHTLRPGKPSLVLDLMEEFRPWVVDRAVIKLRKQLGSEELRPNVRKKLAASILTVLESSIPYKGKKVRLESVMQRQCYRLSGLFSGERHYRPVLFRW